jgi:hypothetical protein
MHFEMKKKKSQSSAADCPRGTEIPNSLHYGRTRVTNHSSFSMTYKIAYAERAAAVTISLITNADCVRQADQVGAHNSQCQNLSRNAGKPFAAVVSAIFIHYSTLRL